MKLSVDSMTSRMLSAEEILIDFSEKDYAGQEIEGGTSITRELREGKAACKVLRRAEGHNYCLRLGNAATKRGSG